MLLLLLLLTCLASFFVDGTLLLLLLVVPFDMASKNDPCQHNWLLIFHLLETERVCVSRGQLKRGLHVAFRA